MTGNTGNTGNTGASLAGGPGDQGGGWTFANRTNLPLVDDPLMLGAGEQPWIPDARPGARTFRDANWGAFWYGWLALAEFNGRVAPTVEGGQAVLRYARAGGASPVPYRFAGPGPVTAEMILPLIELARNERADAMPEIIGQKDEFISYFMGLLMATPASHPATHRLFQAASLIALYTGLFYKAAFSVARPHELYPGLLPPVEVPGHASYPSGHAAQSRLIALCARRMLSPAEGRLDDARGVALEVLARRIARNREIAGLHTAQDTEAGVAMAERLAEILVDMKGRPNDCPVIAAMFAAATAEWAERRPVPFATAGAAAAPRR